MGCNCGKGKRPRPSDQGGQAPGAASARKPTFILADNQTGRTQTFGSRLEAEAAKARAGGLGRIIERH